VDVQIGEAKEKEVMGEGIGDCEFQNG